MLMPRQGGGRCGNDRLAGTRTRDDTAARSCYFHAAFLMRTGYFALASPLWTH